jgi:hypothetical protein
VTSWRRREDLGQRTVERRQREDAAPRLRAEIPSLTRLSLAVQERPGPAPGHVRHIMVDSAAALFLVPCAASGCQGFHDLTSAIMRELRRASDRFEGDTGCDACGCVLHHVATAEYR